MIWEWPGAAEGIGTGAKRILITPDVGELDFLGYSVKDVMLVVLECKMARDSTEPRLFRDDISDFVTSKNNYQATFARKVAWATENAQQICEALRSVQIYIDKSRLVPVRRSRRLCHPSRRGS